MNLLAIDQGTSSTKALVVDEEGRVAAEAAVAVHPRAVGPDGVEHDAELLLASIVEAGRRAVDAAGLEIDAVGLANQGETVVAFDPHSGQALGPAIVWQDRRAAGLVDELAPHAEELLALSGLPLDPYFTAPKLRWLTERAPAGARSPASTPG